MLAPSVETVISPPLSEGWSLSEMAWSKPQFTRGQVDAAGRILAPVVPVQASAYLAADIDTLDAGFELEPDIDIDNAEWDDALNIISNWRSAHSYPLLATRVTLTSRARKIDDRAIIAQRLKRLTS